MKPRTYLLASVATISLVTMVPTVAFSENSGSDQKEGVVNIAPNVQPNIQPNIQPCPLQGADCQGPAGPTRGSGAGHSDRRYLVNVQPNIQPNVQPNVQPCPLGKCKGATGPTNSEGDSGEVNVQPNVQPNIQPNVQPCPGGTCQGAEGPQTSRG